MTSAGVRWWLLAEDPIHERLALKLAPALKLNERPVKAFISPSGRGAASAWVVHQFAARVATIRSRPGERVFLLVIVDGDNVGLANRKLALEGALKVIGTNPREANEPIAILVPTWSVETWLAGVVPGINESTPMKEKLRNPTSADFLQAVRRIVSPLMAEPLRSVMDATNEVRRAP